VLAVLIVKEWVTDLLELRFLVCAALCVFLGVVSVFVLRADLATKRTEYFGNQAIYRTQAEEYGSYSELERQGVHVDRPPQSFQVLFYGMEKSLDRTAQVSEDFVPGFQGDLKENPMVLLFPVADLLFVVGVVLSLLAFFISYDAVSGERESGTLMLLMSYSVPRDLLILAKWVGGYLSLALPFVVTLVIGALMISASAEIPFSGDDWLAFGVTGVVSLLLIAVMFSIGLLVSVLARESGTAILMLLALWVILALVLPNVGPYLAEIVAPVPDVGEVQREIAQRTKGMGDEFATRGRGMRRRMRNMSREQRTAYFRERNQKREELRAAVNEASEEVIRDFERQLQRQIDVARTITRLSPVAAYVYANTDIGETGVRHERQLVSGLREYQRQLSRYIDEKQGDGGGGGFPFGGSQDEDYVIDDLPVFEPRSEILAGRVAARGTDIMLLGIYAVLFFMGAFVSFLRADIN